MADTENTTTDENAEEKTGIQHFDGTVSKIDSNGRLVASSYVDYDNGEKLAGDADEEEVNAAQAETSKQADDELKESEAAQSGDNSSSDAGSEPAPSEPVKAAASSPAPAKTEPAKTADSK